MLFWIKSASLVTVFFILFSGCSTKFSTSKRYDSKQSYHTNKTIKSELKVTSHTIPKSSKRHPTMRPYKVLGQNYYPHKAQKGDIYEGVSSWYGPDFNGKLTSNGETYDMYALTCAHKTLPMNTILRVTNLENNKDVIVRVNDRGPFVKQRIIDLSKAAAYEIAMTEKGTAQVRIEVLGFYDKDATSSKAINTEPVREKIPDLQDVESTVSTIEPDEKKNYASLFVQIGSFSRFSGAQEYKERFERLGIEKQVLIKEFVVNAQQVFKVLVGKFENEENARKFITEHEGLENAFIVRN